MIEIIWFIGIPVLLGILTLILLHNELKGSSEVDEDNGDETDSAGEE